jgi:hypothetical protein
MRKIANRAKWFFAVLIARLCLAIPILAIAFNAAYGEVEWATPSIHTFITIALFLTLPILSVISMLIAPFVSTVFSSVLIVLCAVILEFLLTLLLTKAAISLYTHISQNNIEFEIKNKT